MDSKERNGKGHPVDGILRQADELKAYFEKNGYEPLEQLVVFLDTLKDAIVSLTNADLVRSADLLQRLKAITTDDLFRSIGELTRELHESIKDIQLFLEPILTNITEEDIQGLSSKLTHVSTLVKDTSEKTLDLLFARQEKAVADNAVYGIIARHIMADEKKEALKQLKLLKDHNHELVNELMRISELQIHADLVDQIVKKVCRVVENMELRLVDLIRRYSRGVGIVRIEPGKRDGTKIHGPVIPGQGVGVATSQDDVDGLLKSLGL
ncbi:MAG TPA: protein phosphatase CheZ [Deltaproteobacteria bacterium]|nr:protein phosphatase CheZ [Deltaproteobacteria bacterium]HPR54605.1 protein phosphatase CheZ [Deltaproteobacteria bacterium]HXK47263.1 protein phosphatase CheZ [Deltaproteobacteria bacterium]